MTDDACDNPVRIGISAAPAWGSIPPSAASAAGPVASLPSQSAAPARVALSDHALTQAFTPRVPPGILRELLEGYDVGRARRLISGFTYGFSIGGVDVPEGRTLRNLSSCLAAPDKVDEYIRKEQQAGRLAGPCPCDYSGIRKISPIGLVSKKDPGSFTGLLKKVRRFFL